MRIRCVNLLPLRNLRDEGNGRICGFGCGCVVDACTGENGEGANDTEC